MIHELISPSMTYVIPYVFHGLGRFPVSRGARGREFAISQQFTGILEIHMKMLNFWKFQLKSRISVNLVDFAFQGNPPSRIVDIPKELFVVSRSRHFHENLDFHQKVQICKKIINFAFSHFKGKVTFCGKWVPGHRKPLKRDGIPLVL